MGATAPAQLADGLWSWSCRHPEWHPGEFGAQVASFAARGEGALQLIDPLVPEERPEQVLRLLDAEASRAGRIALLITIGYHVRSAEALWRRWREEADVSIHGHPSCLKRLSDSAGAFEEIVPGEPLPGDAVGHRIGRPQRTERPLYLAAHEAVVFGDAVVGVDGGLRIWATRPIDDRVERFHRERFNPTLQPLIDLGAERMLMTHGSSVLEDGSAALQRAVELPPWYHRPD